MKDKKTLLLCVFFLITGIIIGGIITSNTTADSEYNETHTGQKRLTNKLLDFDIPPSHELGNLKTKIETAVTKSINENNAARVSVYFRDLNNGPWIGINEKERFIPASILKVPVMMIYYKKAESNPDLLRSTLTFTGKPDQIYGDKFFNSEPILKDGQKYMIDDLIKIMIKYSDNDALMLLGENLDPGIQRDLYEKLGFDLPDKSSPLINFTSARNIGAFFRVLYNATYLNEVMSEKALQVLTETNFDRGITAGVPENVTVAHKYGEREQNGEVELHDCGIVYYPDHPYILCVMTAGTDHETLSTLIKEISAITYGQVRISN